MKNGNVYEMNGYRVIDMAKHIDPKDESRLCLVDRHGPGHGLVPGYGSTLTVTTHLGTHIEGPSHQHEGWPGIGELPVTTFIGRGLLVDFKDTVPERGIITYEDMDRLCLSRIREGDILILDSDWKLPPFTADSNTEKDRRLIIGTDVANWCVDHKVKAMGFGDGITVECGAPGTTWMFHEIMLRHNKPFVEVLQNVEELKEDHFFFMCAPLPIKGIDSGTTWAVAIEGMEGF